MSAIVPAARIPTLIVHADGSGQFLGVDWGAFVVVFLVALVATVVIVSFYSVGLRLLAVGARPDADGLLVKGPRPVAATIGAYACIGVGILGVLYGIYLIIPQFHQ
jgi:ABC-type uncharacterized transport system permease subunit